MSDDSLDPLVTVITPAYNRREFISEAVESVLNQSYRNIEYIVVDDGSNDGTFEILQGYEAEKKLILLVHEGRENRGQSAALNLGLRHAAGDYIVILDSDDCLAPNKVRDQVAFLEENPDVGMIYGQAMAVAADGRELFPIPGDDHREDGDPNSLLRDCYMALPGGALVRASVFRRAGLFEEEFRAGQDHDMVLRIAEQAPFVFKREIVFYYRKHEDSISQQGLERRWVTGFSILERASNRYPYRSSTIRKRRAVLHFRLAQVCWDKKEYQRSIFHLILSGVLDPFRALGVLAGFERAH